MTERNELRAAIIGAGLMGRWHADAVVRIGGRVTVIVDPDESARLALGRRFPSARTAGALDVADIASHARVAHVCTPLETHAPIVSSLIEAGLHVLVEKPFTDAVAEAEAILARAAVCGRLICPVHQFLFQDGVRELLDAVPRLGTLRRLEFSACSAGAEGLGAAESDHLVADILPHPLSLAAAVLGAPMAGREWSLLHPAPGEFSATAVVGPTVVAMAISASGRPTENQLRVVADRGTVVADLYHGYAVRMGPSTSRGAKIARPFEYAARSLVAATTNLARRTLRQESAYPGLRTLVRSFYEAVASQGPSPVPPESVRDSVAARAQLLTRLGHPTV